MPGHPLIRYRVALLSAVSAVPATGATQFRVDLVPYAGLYLPTTTLMQGGVLKQKASPALGSRITVWLLGRVGMEGTMSYAPSNLTTTDATDYYPGPHSAHLITRTAKLVVRVNPAGDNTVFQAGGGVGRVGYRGAAYCGGAAPCDPYLRADVMTFPSKIVTAGAAFRPRRSVALRVDAEDYLFSASFSCRNGGHSPGVCFSGTPYTPKRQNDFVVSLGVALRVLGS